MTELRHIIPYRRVVVGWAIVLQLFVPTATAATTAPPASSESVIFIVDRSASMGMLRVPDTVQSLITHYIQVAQLARRPVRFAVIVYRGAGVTVFGDQDGLPTLAYQTLLERLHREFPAPAGGTPMAEAFEACQSMLAKLPADERVTVQHISDGAPMSQSDPDRHPAVADYMAKRKAAVTRGVPAEEQQDKIDELRREWQNPESPEGKRLWQLYEREELAECKKLAEGFRSRRVRFVSVDYNGIDALRELHEAAGGLPEDYLTVQPANRLIQMLDDRGLTRYDGVLISPPIRNDPTSGQAKHVQDIPLSQLADAALVTVVFDTPLANFRDTLQLAAKAGGRVVKFDVDGTDPDARIGLDSAGHVATASLMLPVLPRDAKITIGYRCRGGCSSLPALTIYVHQRLRTDVQMVLKPLNSQPADRPPYQVAPTQPVIWQAYVHEGDTGEPLAIASLDAVLTDTREGRSLQLDMAPDAQTVGVFATREATRLPEGKYDATVSVVLKGGHPLDVRLADHIHSRRADEHATIEFDDTSASPFCVDGGDLGDAETTRKVKCLLRSTNMPYPVDVRVEVVELLDADGNSLPPAAAHSLRNEFTLQPGRPTPVVIAFQVPDYLGNVVDGPVAGRLAVTRRDVNAPMEVRAYKNPDAGDVPADTVRFFLRRARLVLSAPRAGRNELKPLGPGYVWPIHVDFGSPFTRRLTLVAATTSDVDRTVSVELLPPFRSADGRSYPAAEIVPADGQDAVREVPRGGHATWAFDLFVPKDLPRETLAARVRVAGAGLLPVEFQVEIQPRPAMLAGPLQQALRVIAAIAGIGLLGAVIRLVRMRKYRQGETLRLVPGDQWQFLRVEQGAADGLQLVVEGTDVTCRTGQDGRPLPARATYLLDAAALKEDPLLFTQMLDDEEEGISILVTAIDTSGDEPGLVARLVDPGPYDVMRQRAARRAWRRLALACAAGLLSTQLYQPAVVGALQWLWDAIRIA